MYFYHPSRSFSLFTMTYPAPNSYYHWILNRKATVFQFDTETFLGWSPLRMLSVLSRRTVLTTELQTALKIVDNGLGDIPKGRLEVLYIPLLQREGCSLRGREITRHTDISKNCTMALYSNVWNGNLRKCTKRLPHNLFHPRVHYFGSLFIQLYLRTSAERSRKNGLC